MSGDRNCFFTLAEVAKHNDSQSTWIVLDDKVYDVTKFLLEHPGGEEVILNLAGQDVTDEFNDVGHSADARTLADDYLVGQLHPDDRKNANEPAETAKTEPRASWMEILTSPTWSNFFIPLAISLAVYSFFKVSQRTL